MTDSTSVMVRVSLITHAWITRHPGAQFLLEPHTTDPLSSSDLLYLINRVSELEATVAAKDAQIATLTGENTRLGDALVDIKHRILMEQTVAQQCEQDEDVLKIVLNALYPPAALQPANKDQNQ